jgi:predicted HTH domain antitoxin
LSSGAAWGGVELGVLIPDEVLDAAGMTETELQQELAVMLYERGRLSLGRASRLAGMGRLEFQRLLASRQIPMQYDIADLKADIETLRSLGHL